VTFVLPPPPMLARGWARNVTRNKKMELTEEQETFLWKLWDPNRKVTAAVLREAMDTHFAGRQELQVLEFEVQRWLDGVYRQAKADDKAKEDKAKGTGEDDVLCTMMTTERVDVAEAVVQAAAEAVVEAAEAGQGQR